jgi:hypothetical protein
VNIQSEKLSKEIDQVNEEIKRLEDTLMNVAAKSDSPIFMAKIDLRRFCWRKL